jgi:hypothetical protein
MTSTGRRQLDQPAVDELVGPAEVGQPVQILDRVGPVVVGDPYRLLSSLRRQPSATTRADQTHGQHDPGRGDGITTSVRRTRDVHTAPNPCPDPANRRTPPTTLFYMALGTAVLVSSIE